MPHTDPITDMLTRIRNALGAKRENVSIPSSKIKMSILEILVAEGYINSFRVMKDKGRAFLDVGLKYKPNGDPCILNLKKISTPGKRVYSGYEDIPKVRSGYGISILSTSKGIMTDRKAKQERIGGELLCSLY